MINQILSTSKIVNKIDSNKYTIAKVKKQEKEDKSICNCLVIVKLLILTNR